MLYHPVTNLLCPSLPEGFIPPSPPADQRMRAKKQLAKHLRTHTGRVLCPGSAEYSVELAKLNSGMTGGMQDLSGVATQQYGSTSTLTDASFYYEFENTSWLDSTVGGNTLTGSGSPTSNTGKIGNAIYTASASSQFLKHVDASAFDMSGTSFTLTCWAYATTLPSFTALVSKMRTSSVAEYYLFNDGSSTWHFAIFNSIGNTDDAIWAGTAPSTATWYWLEAFKDTTNNIISINVNNGTATTAASSKPISHQATAQFGIGARVLGGAGDSYWNGRIDSAGGWKRLLTSAEKSFLYNSGNGADPPF